MKIKQRKELKRSQEKKNYGKVTKMLDLLEKEK